MASKTIEEKLKVLDEKEAQLKAQRKALKARASQEERKARTKRLINAGGSVEAIMKDLTGEEEYPAEGERLKSILDLLRSGYKAKAETNAESVGDDFDDFFSLDSETDSDTKRQARIGKICEKILGRSFSEEDIEKFKGFLQFQYDHGYYPKQMNR